METERKAQITLDFFSLGYLQAQIEVEINRNTNYGSRRGRETLQNIKKALENYTPVEVEI